TEVDSTFVDYRWQPETNLIDLKTKVWGTYLKTRNQRAFQFLPSSYGPVHYGLPADFRNGSNTLMWGVDASNKSNFTTQYGKLEVDLGGSLKIEDTGPDENSKYLIDNLTSVPGFFYYAPREGTHKEWAGFSKFKWSPTEWLTAKAGLKYQRYQSTDDNTPNNNNSSGGFSQSLGLTVTPFDEVQIYGQVSSTLRMPTLFETISVSSLSTLNSSLKPERSNNLEIGINFNTSDLLSKDDLFMAKLEYFDWTVSDYVAREFFTDPVTNIFGSRMFNIDKAHFSGIEFSTIYENNGFKAEWAANYYTDIAFCRTAGQCEAKSLYSDYSTNQIPPEYMTNLTLSQKFFSDSLTIGGRVLHVGPRAIGHGDATSQGAQQFIALVEWEAHTLFDAFAEYEINENLKLSLRGENLTDELYIDPLSLANLPAPGRTIYGSLTIEF
ncbi:MAG: TonB-dependent receptor, partial [Parvibaculaceae bacterium]|nr:TonB-dependent receptor [Parvibaculaceae bacterium]